MLQRTPQVDGRGGEVREVKGLVLPPVAGGVAWADGTGQVREPELDASTFSD